MKAGKTVAVENEAGKGFVNVSQSGSLKIVKTSSDGKVEGFSFRVTSENGYDETFTTDKNGEIFIQKLCLILSIVTDAYIMPNLQGTPVRNFLHDTLYERRFPLTILSHKGHFFATLDG